MDPQKQAYREEASELIADMEDALVELEQSPTDRDLIDRIFRDMHTIKGSGAMFGFNNIATFTHGIETVYDLIREGRIKVSGELVSLTLAACDQIKLLLEDVDATGDSAHITEISHKFAAMIPSAEPEPSPVALEPEEHGEATFRIRFTPKPELFENGTNPLPLLDELRDLGESRVICHLDRLPDLEALDPQKCYVYWDIILTAKISESDIRDVFIFVDDISDIAIAQIDSAEELDDYKPIGQILVEKGDLAASELDAALSEQKRLGQVIVEKGLVPESELESALTEQEYVRDMRLKRRQVEASASVKVASFKLDSLVDLVGELVIVQARLSEFATRRGDPDLAALAEDVERLSAELRDQTMDIRMLPIGTTFARFKRLVRDLANELGKEIDFTTAGAETELDKTVIDKLGDPLVHLIRNSVDHGIELPADRRAAGKAEQGRIHLSAQHSGAYVLISIEDDGRGLNTRAIREKAIAKGILAPEAQPSEKEIFELIFAPGFSTAENVSAISGRGVGMDVVSRNIEALGGSVEIQSQAGSGTVITLKLPLTLAIIDGLLVELAGNFFVLPLGCVLECIELSQTDVNRAHGRHMVNVRGEIVPYIPLREVFSLSGEIPESEQIVITGIGDRRVGFVVDRVIGQHQTVIKTLGKALKDMDGISGATILGNGTVALILDVNRLTAYVEQEELSLTG